MGICAFACAWCWLQLTGRAVAMLDLPFRPRAALSLANLVAGTVGMAVAAHKLSEARSRRWDRWGVLSLAALVPTWFLLPLLALGIAHTTIALFQGHRPILPWTSGNAGQPLPD